MLTSYRIAELLKQLFWRQNRYHHNNKQYINNRHRITTSLDGSQSPTIPVSIPIPKMATEVDPSALLPPAVARQGIQVGSSATLGASSKRHAVDEALHPPKRKRQLEERADLGTQITARDTDATHTARFERPIDRTPDNQCLSPKRRLIAPMAIMTAPGRTLDGLGVSTVHDISGSRMSRPSRGGPTNEGILAVCPTIDTAITSPVNIGSIPQPSLLEQSIAPRLKPKTQVPLFIVTYEPNLTETLWVNGNVLGSTLSEFVDSLPNRAAPSHIKSITLILRSVGFLVCDTKIKVRQDDEDSWNYLKDAFKNRIREAVKDNKATGVTFKILVEPLYEQAIGKDYVEFVF